MSVFERFTVERIDGSSFQVIDNQDGPKEVAIVNSYDGQESSAGGRAEIIASSLNKRFATHDYSNQAGYAAVYEITDGIEEGETVCRMVSIINLDLITKHESDPFASFDALGHVVAYSKSLNFPGLSSPNALDSMFPKPKANHKPS